MPPFNLPNHKLNIGELKNRCQECQSVVAKLIEEDLPKDLKERLSSLSANLKNYNRDLNQMPSLGLIGNLSSGKTSCIELLLGAVGKLGASQQVGTINAVEYCVEYDPDASQTSFEYRCDFLSKKDCDELLSTFQTSLKEELTTACQNGANPAIKEFALDEIGADGNANENKVTTTLESCDWERIYNWTVELDKKTPCNDLPSLRQAIRELHWLAKSAYWGSGWFGKKCKISPSQAKRLSVAEGFGWHIQKIQDTSPFPPFPTDIEKDNRDYFKLSEDVDCSALRYLVKIIRVDVKTPSDRFTINGALRLVDVPGLGNAGTSIRDKSIMEKTLEGLDAVLFLLDTNNRGFLKDGVQILTNAGVLQRTIVGLSKFDLISLPAKEELQNVVWNCENVHHVSNWNAFESLIEDCENNFGSEPDCLRRFVPFSLFHFLACEAGESDKNVNNLKCDFADYNFLNNPTCAFVSGRTCRSGVRIGIPEIVDALENDKSKANSQDIRQDEIVKMLTSFKDDGGVARLKDAYSKLLTSKAVDNQLATFNMALGVLYKEFNSIDSQIKAYKDDPPPVKHNVYDMLDRWTKDAVWKRLKDAVQNCLDHNKEIEKPVFLARLFLLPMWEELFNSRVAVGKYDYVLQIASNGGNISAVPLVNDPRRAIPQDTEELSKTITRYYKRFVTIVLGHITTGDDRCKALGDVFDAVRKEFKLTDDEQNALIAFASTMKNSGKEDSFGIFANDWNDPNTCNFYDVLSRDFVKRGEEEIQSLRKEWENDQWQERRYPLQLSRGNDKSEPLLFPWNHDHRSEFISYLGSNALVTNEKLSFERIRELRYQLQKACDHLIDEAYFTLKIKLDKTLDEMKKAFREAVFDWQTYGRTVVIDGSNPWEDEFF